MNILYFLKIYHFFSLNILIIFKKYLKDLRFYFIEYEILIF